MSLPSESREEMEEQAATHGATPLLAARSRPAAGERLGSVKRASSVQARRA